MQLREGKVVWVTGGTSGIGLAIARLLQDQGYSVAVSGRNAKRLDGASRVGLTAFECDSRNETSVSECHSQIVRSLGNVHLLINNAGISPFTAFSETSIDEFDDVIATNLTGYFLAARAVLPSMYARREGTIVQILSIASIKAFKGGASYIASKFGALGLTNSLREEARKHNVKVIAILPGATETPLWDEDERSHFRDRMMQPDDIASAIFRVLEQPDRMLTEEMVVRPIGGDL